MSNRYDATVEARIEEDCIALDELLGGKEPSFDYLIDWEALKNRLIAQRYNLGNAFVKTVLSLYSYAEPLNIADGRSASLDKVFSGYYKHNLHHIFPQAYLRVKEPGQKELFDSIVNIMFIPAITNNEIRDKAPQVYLSHLANSNPEFNTILQRHYIPDLNKSGLLENKFIAFLDYRADQIYKAFRIRTGFASELEAHFETNPAKPIDILENRLRSFIHDKLRQSTEESYWAECIPADIQGSVDKKIQEDIKRHPYKLEEYLRDDVRISFLDVMDYAKVILSNWKIYSETFPSKVEIEPNFRALKYYRNAVKHGRDLNSTDKRNGEAAVLWLDNLIK